MGTNSGALIHLWALNTTGGGALIVIDDDELVAVPEDDDDNDVALWEYLQLVP